MDVINFSPSDITFFVRFLRHPSILILNKHRLHYNTQVFNYSTAYLSIELRFRMSAREKNKKTAQKYYKFNHDYIYRSFIKRSLYAMCSLSVDQTFSTYNNNIWFVLCTHELSTHWATKVYVDEKMLIYFILYNKLYVTMCLFLFILYAYNIR